MERFIKTLKSLNKKLTKNLDDSYKSDEYNKWYQYLERDEHVLFGTNTPIFKAKRNQTIKDSQDPLYITYQRIPFVSSLLINS